MRVSIHDVATAAGVSVTTVSYVLNNKGSISAQTRQRVKDAITATGYRRQRRAAGVLTLIQTHQSSLTADLMQAVAEYGYALHVLICSDALQTPPTITARQPIAGLFVFGGMWHRSFLEPLAQQYPTVLLGSVLPTLLADSVWVDNAGGMDRAVNTLVSHGHRRIGLLGGPDLSPTSDEKRLGFTRALHYAHILETSSYVGAEQFTVEAGVTAARELLSQSSPPTAIIAGEMVLGRALLNVVKQKGISVPKDLSVIVFNDSKEFETSHPPITTLAIPRLDIAREAVTTLMHRIDNSQLPGRRLLLQPEYINRGSVISPSDGDSDAVPPDTRMFSW